MIALRSKKAIINTFFSLLSEFVIIISSLIIPRLILSKFGSRYNGITTSITQFLACAVLLRAGIGGATRAALYKPIANENHDEFDSIVKATDNYMKKIGFILAIVILLFALVYPLLVKNEFSYIFSFSLFIIIGIATFAESFFGITYLIVLQADQKLYISSIFTIIANIINIIVVCILITKVNSIHIIKLGTALSMCFYPIALNIYVKRKYKINKNAKPNYKAISQRWAAFWHQIATFVNSNTDVIVLTLFTNMLVVSVYSVYNLVVAGLKKFIMSVTNSIESAFGNMIAKNENEIMKENFSIIEFIIFNIATLVYTCSIILVLQFVAIYTKGITDANYLKPVFAYLLLIGQFFYTISLPYQYIIQAAGHFEQTKKYAIIEAIINIVISICLVIKFGLIGVAIGTLIAMLYKTIMFSNYMSENIIERSKIITIKKCFISICEFLIIYFIYKFINPRVELNYFSWIKNGIIVFTISIPILVIGSILFYRKEIKNLFKKIKNMKNTKKKKVKK